ncbi:MAG: hypothetical protein AAFU85_17615 [Planctomycetota bacterium]
MRTQILRSFAIAAGMSFCGLGAVGHADEPYKSPAKWNNFRTKTRAKAPVLRQVSVYDDLDQAAEELIPPGDARLESEAFLPEPVMQPRQAPMAHEHHSHAPHAAVPHSHAPHATVPHASMPAPMSSSCNSCGPASPYAAATSATWEGSCTPGSYAPASRGPVPISPYFGSFNLLFWNVENNNNRVFVADDAGNGMVYEGDINPGAALGFDAHVGRYFGCGQWGIDVGYLFFDPDRESRDAFDGGGGLRLTLPVLQTVEIDRGGGVATVYDDFDTNATRIRSSRDLRVQGVEINLANFGLMGARRLGSCNPGSVFGGPCKHGDYGNAIGPLARACGGRSRFTMLQGFRWFQLEDELEFIGDVDGVGGYSGTDLYVNMETENNLYGYQFGGIWSYCLGQRLLLNIGGKFGIYGNHARFYHRIGTSTIVANTILG